MKSRETETEVWVHLAGVGPVVLTKVPRFPDLQSEQDAGGYDSPMPGEVIRVEVAPGDTVEAGQTLLVLSSMKMEHSISAFEDGTVEEVLVATGDQIEAGTLMLKMES